MRSTSGISVLTRRLEGVRSAVSCHINEEVQMVTVVRNLLVMVLLVGLSATSGFASDPGCVDEGGIWALDPEVGGTLLCDGWGCVFDSADCYIYFCDEVSQGAGIICN